MALSNPKVGTAVVIPPTLKPSKTNSIEEHQRWSKCRAELHERKSQNTCSTSAKGNVHEKWNRKSQNAPFLEDSGGSTTKKEAARNYKSTDLSKQSHQSKKQKMLKAVNDKFSTALDCPTYRLSENSPPYDDHVVNHVDKWVSGLKVQKKEHIFDLKVPFNKFISSSI